MNFFQMKKHLYGQGKVIQKITILSLLLSISFVLNILTSFISWPLAKFLEMDISLLPIIISLFLFGFKEALIMIIIRFIFITLINVNKIVIWLGPLSQFIFAFFYLAIISFSLKITKKIIKINGLRIIISMIIATFLTSIFATIFNWWWITSLYWYLLGFIDNMMNPYEFNEFLLKNKSIRLYFGNIPNWHLGVWIIFLPFNLVKFGIISLQAIPLISALLFNYSNQKIKFKKEKK